MDNEDCGTLPQKPSSAQYSSGVGDQIPLETLLPLIIRSIRPTNPPANETTNQYSAGI
jgi:hypothetical protein